MIDDLKVFCIINIISLWVTEFSNSELKAKAHNLKGYLFRWNFKAIELLLTYIYLFLSSLSVLFKHKSLCFVNLSFFLHDLSVFWLEHLHIYDPDFRYQLWRCVYFGAKLTFIAGIFLRKYPWCMKIHFQLHIFAIWNKP